MLPLLKKINIQNGKSLGVTNTLNQYVLLPILKTVFWKSVKTIREQFIGLPKATAPKLLEKLPNKINAVLGIIPVIDYIKEQGKSLNHDYRKKK